MEYDETMIYAVLVAYFAVTAAELILRSLNIRHLRRHGGEIPPALAGFVDPALLEKSSSYTVDQSRVELVDSLFDAALVLFFLYFFLGPYDRWISSLTGSFVLGGILFFAILHLVQLVFDIPFGLYTTFRLEARHGFNATTSRLWVADLLKSTCLSLVLLAVVGGGALSLVAAAPDRWWLWVWLFFAAVTVFLLYLSPYIIEPLFHKYEPVRDAELVEELREMAERAGVSVGKVQQVDASRRSRHSNAYFTGIGHVKRIVLYDTLLETMTREEIVAVLAHELGHWKKGHIVKRLLLTEATALVTLYLAHLLIGSGLLPRIVGVDALSFPASVVVLSFIGSILSFAFTPFGSALSRRHEREADAFAAELTGTPEALASALAKLSRDNLSNLHPHPLYAGFYYSHPPVTERVRALTSRRGAGAA
jgi:STE24 endopeptidase